MRILWLSHFFPYPPAGGALQRSYHLLKHAARRHDIHLVSLTKARDRPGRDEAGSEYAEPEAFCRRVDTFPIPAEKSRLRRQALLLQGVVSRSPYDVRWLKSKELADFLLSLGQNQSSYDLVHVDTIGLMQYEAQLPVGTIVLNHHNVESYMMWRRAKNETNCIAQWYLRSEARKLRRLETEICTTCACNLVVSSIERTRLEDSLEGAKVVVVPNGVDVEYFKPANVGTSGEEEGLIFVGRLSWYPNRDGIEWFFREVWPLLSQQERLQRMTVVGDSPPNWLKGHPGPGQIEATGFVPDVRPYMKQAQIYVCPIRTGGGTRLKILDAMAMGMPLVATSLSVEGLGLTDRQHYLRADTAEEFVKAIRELEQSEALRNRLATQARSMAVEEFSWARIGEELERAYQGAISSC